MTTAVRSPDTTSAHYFVFLLQSAAEELKRQWLLDKKTNKIRGNNSVDRECLLSEVIFSSREFRPPEKLEMANLLSDEPTVNSIMTKVIIHVLNVQESIGLDGFQKDSKTNLFGPNGKTDKYWLREKMDFDQASKGHVLAHIRSIFFTFQSPGRGYMKRTLLSFLVRLSPSFDPSFVGPVRHIRQRSKSDEEVDGDGEEENLPSFEFIVDGEARRTACKGLWTSAVRDWDGILETAARVERARLNPRSRRGTGRDNLFDITN
ncbi:hypothetical protein DY000_02038898 [Brassica cretica]|uniref:Uncharacterized protein n=1 Tax=Brassica cretica TaxID=69181 RepID=A0ABQ7BQ53_BRACR|nr:hypothetical protein DY000_02038898 [Brassica cretica]